MEMGIVESRHDEMPTQIDDLGLWPLQFQNFIFRSYVLHPTASNRDGFAAERQRNIRVGRSPLYLRGVAEMRVRRPNHLQDPSIRVQFASGTIADDNNLRAQPGWLAARC